MIKLRKKNKNIKLMSRYLKKGQQCIACVDYKGGEQLWIIGNVQKLTDGGSYIINDPYSEDDNCEDNYTVEQGNIAPFPQHDQTYKEGENILALWCSDGEWTTSFYAAIVVKVLDDNRLVIKYLANERSQDIIIDTSKVSHYPANFQQKKLHEDPGYLSNQNENNFDKKSANNEAGSDGDAKDDKNDVSAKEIKRLKLTPEPQYVYKEKHDPKPLTDDDFDKLAGPRPVIKRMECKKGYPLIEFLNDETLFPKIHPHVTGCGVLRRRNIEKGPCKSALAEGSLRNCGRLGKILFEWRGNVKT